MLILITKEQLLTILLLLSQNQNVPQNKEPLIVLEEKVVIDQRIPGELIEKNGKRYKVWNTEEPKILKSYGN